jgi:hypothetical protein
VVINYAQMALKRTPGPGHMSDENEAIMAILGVIKRCGAKLEKGKVGFFRVARFIGNTQAPKTGKRSQLSLNSIAEGLLKGTKRR